MPSSDRFESIRFDLYRVNFEVNDPKPFACLAFPQTSYSETLQKRPIFGDELVTSFHRDIRTFSTLRSLVTAPS